MHDTQGAIPHAQTAHTTDEQRSSRDRPVMSHYTSAQTAYSGSPDVQKLLNLSVQDQPSPNKGVRCIGPTHDNVPGVLGRRCSVGAAHGGVRDGLPVLRRHVQLLQSSRRRRRCASRSDTTVPLSTASVTMTLSLHAYESFPSLHPATSCLELRVAILPLSSAGVCQGGRVDRAQQYAVSVGLAGARNRSIRAAPCERHAIDVSVAAATGLIATAYCCTQSATAPCHTPVQCDWGRLRYAHGEDIASALSPQRLEQGTMAS